MLTKVENTGMIVIFTICLLHPLVLPHIYKRPFLKFTIHLLFFSTSFLYTFAIYLLSSLLFLSSPSFFSFFFLLFAPLLSVARNLMRLTVVHLFIFEEWWCSVLCVFFFFKVKCWMFILMRPWGWDQGHVFCLAS